MTTYKLLGASIIAASLALIGCDDSNKEKAKEEVHKVEEAAKNTAEAIVDKAKELEAKVEDKVSHGVEAIKEKAHETVSHDDAPKVEDHAATTPVEPTATEATPAPAAH